MQTHAPNLRAALEALEHPSASATEDYQIAAQVGAGYLARARSGMPAFLVPLASIPHAAGRRGGGFLLSHASLVVFDYQGKRWEQAAATLECTDFDLVDTFLVLVVDLADRLDSGTSWKSIVAWVEEWQVLLGRRVGLTAEQQLGLWGELWLMSQSAIPDLLLAAWRGPDRDAVDFFLDGVGIEVKVSRRPHVHHVSQKQVEIPVGEHHAHVLSLWVAPDPVRGVSLCELVDILVARVADAAVLLRRIASLGYSPHDRELYVTRYLPLETPLWFRASDIPRVRAIDHGITQLRYVVSLDPERSLDIESAKELWQRICRIDGPLEVGESL